MNGRAIEPWAGPCGRASDRQGVHAKARSRETRSGGCFVLAILRKDKYQPTRRLRPQTSFRSAKGEQGGTAAPAIVGDRFGRSGAVAGYDVRSLHGCFTELPLVDASAVHALRKDEMETTSMSGGWMEGVASSTPVARCVHPERSGAVVRRSSPGVDGATPSIGSKAIDLWFNRRLYLPLRLTPIGR